jgi:hypothetical protein
MNFPVADAFEPGEPLLRRLDRPSRTARGSDDDRALAAAEKFIESRNFIDEPHAIARHLSPSQSGGQTQSWFGDRPVLMIWINFDVVPVSTKGGGGGTASPVTGVRLRSFA